MLSASADANAPSKSQPPAVNRTTESLITPAVMLSTGGMLQVPP
jgi:hypothetical protein